MASPAPVLVICTANICRSPMAEALLRHALAAQPEPLRSIPVMSAGVAARGGEPATEHSLTALKRVGIDATSHISRPLTQAMLDRALAVIVMTQSHRDMIESMAERPPARLLLFRQFVPGGSKEIADPYGCPLAAYEAARDEMVEAVPSLVEYLRSLVRT